MTTALRAARLGLAMARANPIYKLQMNLSQLRQLRLMGAKNPEWRRPPLVRTFTGRERLSPGAVGVLVGTFVLRRVS